MLKYEVSVSASEEGKLVRNLKVELVSMGEGRHQPVITFKDHKTGAGSVTRLPVGNYTNLLGKLNKATESFDAQSAQKLVQRLISLTSLLG